MGDFNGDGKQDLATANYNSANGSVNVSVLLGDGNGAFGSAISFGGAGSGSTSVAVGDFNGDGKQDLAAANQSSFNVSIRLGNGSGGFGSAPTFGAGGNPSAVAVGDFNGDGRQDLAVANFTSSGKVSVLLGNCPPTLATVAGGTVVIGSGARLTDTAMLFGGFNPTGTITFTLYDPSNVAVYTDVVTVNGNGSYDTSTGNNPGGYLPTVTGTYLWTATYSGDTNNTGATDNGQNENQAVTEAGPSINTVAGGTVVLGSGNKLTDTAVLAGGFNPTGTITFTLYDPSNVAVYTNVAMVSGNGTYDTSTGTNPGGYLPTTTGTYLWSATYNGDANNNPATDNGQNESQTVSQSNECTVCHKRATLVLSCNGLEYRRHIDHGDTVGPCPSQAP